MPKKLMAKWLLYFIYFIITFLKVIMFLNNIELSWVSLIFKSFVNIITFHNKKMFNIC